MTRPGFAIRRHRARPAPAALVALGVALCLAAGTGVGLATDIRPDPAAYPGPADDPAAGPGPADGAAADSGSADGSGPAAGSGDWRPGCTAGCATGTGTLPGVPTPPTRVRVARIGVDSTLTALGLDRAGTLVPPADFTRAGWYGGGPAPGDPGPAVIAGHLDSRRGPAVFARLGELRPGDQIEVWRGDRQVPFRVTRTLRTPKDAFPTATVYGPTPGPELRLITCGGDFDRHVRHYRDNVVVFAVADPPADPVPRSAAD
ncbi:class F sortase [Micromonospora rifamycinica]|uniref:class F sortase n=1 Tax=Micromonospora rifamycinica TaxID=291594 RepID=UPI002E2E661F|nr:class F sortase [Micromonospora rifamycinica]